ncbi:FkbM family methyltransferase [Streptomyces sp. TRM68367]|uniref:FkbM family methyltransferase n=1 Tax=Streptomyces sp. TRM68367 TaxID=2758415 RepID=UPI00165CA5EB|nr:FkbM family methyltransferase [Streptomyces sp. TRM68367]MBC9724550.1 FkbM family methyltransferase [Streptomyces sp. TRM68367]
MSDSGGTGPEESRHRQEPGTNIPTVPCPGGPLRQQLPDGPAVWCTNGPAAVAMWREMLPPGAYDRAARGLRDGGTVVDVGANIGLLSVLCARTRRRVRVIAAEPAPALHACLVRNLAEHAAPGWAAECVAAADRPGRLRFTYYPEAPGNSGLHADRAADDEISLIFLRNSRVAPEDAAELLEGLHEGVECTVPALTVSDLLRRHAVSRVDLLKVDVERAELDVLRGIEDLHWPLIHTVVVEVHDEAGRLTAVQNLLHRHGFTLEVHQDPLLAGTGLYELEAVREC